MQAYRLRRGARIEGLERVDYQLPALAAHEVRIRIRAVALNFRDLLIANRATTEGTPFVPGSDGAGEVVAIGSAVTRVGIGDRVIANFFPDWVDGDPTPQNTAVGLGGGGVGMLAEEVLLPEQALMHVPAYLSPIEAATLPCAGLTAWNALFGQGAPKPGSTVLLLGTGGVSIWALQLAKAAGLRVVITSSDDGKLERARALGADHTINYRTSPDWGQRVVQATGGRGVDLVVETGGRSTLSHSVAATRMGGRIAVVGGTSGFGIELDTFALVDGARHITGVLVGSRAMMEDLGRFIEQREIRPAIDRIFSFDEVPAAYTYLEAARHFGKVVIDIPNGES